MKVSHKNTNVNANSNMHVVLKLAAKGSIYDLFLKVDITGHI